MKAAFVVEPYKVELRDIPKPVTGDGDVLVKVHCAGVCGSDLHLFKGIHAFRKLPCILGHEQAGVVAEVGKNVTRVKVGDRVTVNPLVLCGKCRYCAMGKGNLCESRIVPGTGSWIGSFSEYFPAPESVVYKIADGVSFEAAMMTEPLANSYHMLKEIKAPRRETIAILGSGTIGLGALYFARGMGYKKIICTDIAQDSLTVARMFGADIAVNPLECDLKAVVDEATEGMGVDVCIVSGAADDILDQACDITRKGGDISLASMITRKIPFFSYAIGQKEQCLRGTFLYSTQEYEEVLDMINKGADVDKFITHRVPFEQTQRALEILNDKSEPVLKVAVEF